MKFPNFVLPVFTLLSFLFTQSLAQSTVPYDPSPFSSIGIVQAATVNDITDVLSGGTLLVNGLTVIIPRNLLVTLPSITVSWQELFKPDETLNLPMFGVKSWEVSVTGNFVGGEYIAGLVYIFQELLHTSSGFISNIDYATGELRIGGSFSDPTTGTRVIINDPVGRFGKVYADWPLLTADTDNPSIKAMTGFPMCIPRFDPATTVDPLCPKKNRPTNSLGRALQAFNFDAPPVAATRPDPNVFAPLMKGDYVFFSGVYVTGDLIAAYSIEANLGLYTALGRKPSYLTITTAQWGIVGDPAGEIAETRIEGYTTDDSTAVTVFAIDVDPCTGVESERVLAVVSPRRNGRRGQWRYRTTAEDITPATREVGARMATGVQTNANGIIAGQFIQPIMDDGFIFPELVVFGQPWVVNEFDLIPFIAQGSGPWTGGIPGTTPNPAGPIVGQLDPWPGVFAPTPADCPEGPILIPRAFAGFPQTVRPLTQVTLTGSSGTSNLPEESLTYLWEQVTSPGNPPVALTGANTKIATFNTPAVTGADVIFTFRLTVSNAEGESNSTVTVTVTNAEADLITIESVTYENHGGTSELQVIAASSVTDGTAVLSLSTVNPAIASTPMTSLGGGRFQLMVNVRPAPDLITITSNLGGRVSTVTPP